MVALFRTFYFPRIFPSASNLRSKSAVNVVRTRPFKNSLANQRFLRPVGDGGVAQGWQRHAALDQVLVFDWIVGSCQKIS